MRLKQNPKHRQHKPQQRWMAVPIALAMLAGTAVMPAAIGKGYAASKSAQPAIQLKTIPMIVNGQALQVPAGMVESETYIGLRFLSEQLGMAAKWDPKTNTVSVSKKNKAMTMKAGSNEFTVNEHRIYGSAPIALKGTTYLPLRFLLEQMGFRIGYDGTKKTVTIQNIQENDVIMTNKMIDTPYRKLSLTLQYPQLSGWKDAAVQDKINSFLTSKVKEYEKSGKSLIDDAYEWGYEEDLSRVTYSLDYTVTYNEQNKLSLYFDIYLYSGGVHGMYDYVGYTFDLTTGEELSLKQATGNHPDYINIINREIKKQLKQSEIILMHPFETIKADQRYFLRGNAIVVYFSLYEYLPYAAGIPEFSIPLSAFK
ncbi:stalk domain-containing protein [Paenibacillus sp. GCM10027626]|uniref:stalk domain-containing protein n=1 Tax=Paenibacillus sp. GCM10027626 TaxID=3273411 RepID=UPI003641BEC1